MRPVISFGSFPVRTQRQTSIQLGDKQSVTVSTAHPSVDTVNLRFGSDVSPKRQAKVKMQSLLWKLCHLKLDEIQPDPFTRMATVQFDQDIFDTSDYKLYIDLHSGGLVLDSVEQATFDRTSYHTPKRRIRYIPTSQGGPEIRVHYYPDSEDSSKYSKNCFRYIDSVRLKPDSIVNRQTIAVLDNLHDKLLPRLNEVSKQKGELPVVSEMWDFLKELSTVTPGDKVEEEIMPYYGPYEYEGRGMLPRSRPPITQTFRMQGPQGEKLFDFRRDRDHHTTIIAPHGHLDDPENVQPGPFLQIRKNRNNQLEIIFIKRDGNRMYSLQEEHDWQPLYRETSCVMEEVGRKVIDDLDGPINWLHQDYEV